MIGIPGAALQFSGGFTETHVPGQQPQTVAARMRQLGHPLNRAHPRMGAFRNMLPNLPGFGPQGAQGMSASTDGGGAGAGITPMGTAAAADPTALTPPGMSLPVKIGIGAAIVLALAGGGYFLYSRGSKTSEKGHK